MTTIRVQTILVLGVLLSLLLLLPRLDDPPQMRMIGGEISRVEKIQGAALYVDTGASGIALVYVTELRMHQDLSGVAYVTKLNGTTLGANGEPERFSIDVTERASAFGWSPAAQLDGLVSPGNNRGCHAFEFRRLRFRRVIHKGQDVLFVVGRVEGQDLVTGHVVSEEYTEGTACPAIPFLERVSVASASGSLEGFWALTGTMCWQSGREPNSPGLPGWTAGYWCN